MDWLFESWGTLARTWVVAVAMYVACIVIRRISGKRTLSKWNAFDSIVTIAMGSAVATAVLSRQTSLAEGIVGFGTLVTLQFALTWSTLRIGPLRRLVKSDPTLLVLDGEVRHEALRRERVSERELRAAVRSSGIAHLEDVAAVILETDGAISVLPRGERPTEEIWAIADLLEERGR